MDQLSPKFPLVLDPVVAGSQLPRVLIDGGSGFFLLLASVLKKMGLGISNMLSTSKATFLPHCSQKLLYVDRLCYSLLVTFAPRRIFALNT